MRGWRAASGMANLFLWIVEAEKIASNFKASVQPVGRGPARAGLPNRPPRDGPAGSARQALDSARALGASRRRRSHLPRAAAPLRPHLLERAERTPARAAGGRHRRGWVRPRLRPDRRRRGPAGSPGTAGGVVEAVGRA